MNNIDYDKAYDMLRESEDKMDDALELLKSIKHKSLDVEIEQSIVRLKEAIYWINEPTGEM